MNTTILKNIAKMVEDEYNKTGNAVSSTATTSVANNTIATAPCCSVSNILIDNRMLRDIEAANYGNGIVDTTKLTKVAANLRNFEDKYNMSHNAYMLTGYSDINNFKVESITVDFSSGKYTLTGNVVGTVNNGVLEMTAMISSKVNI